MARCSTNLETLASLAHPQGGWGYAPGQPPHLEPTCLALLALNLEQERFGEVITLAQKFVASCAGPDGGYRLAHGRPEAVWPTALVLFVQAALGAPAEVLDRPTQRLMSTRGRKIDNPEAGELQDIDMTLVGWPWAENNFSWAEPTAWACLALRAVGLGKHQRVLEGIFLLLDRAMDEGGINYGNRRVLGRSTEPIPTVTALFLLAVQGQNHPRIDAALRYLMEAAQGNDLEHLAWSKLALDVYRDRPGVAEYLKDLDDRIQKAQEDRKKIPWVQPAVVREALAALALGSELRNFFRLDSPAVPGVSLASHPQVGTQTNPFSQRVGTWFRGLAVKAVGQMRPLPAFSSVHIARASSYETDLLAILQAQFQHFRDKVPLAGKRVVLKPNLVEYHRDKVINTNPRVVEAVIQLCKAEGAAEIIVAEGPGHWRNVEFLVKESGLGEVLEKHGVPFVDINHDEPVKTPNLGRLTGLEYLYLSRTVAAAEVLISLPKLKTHHWAGATLSLKNLFGTLPGICYGWPKNELHWRGIDNSIVDIALTRTPDLAIVDGIVGMEGDGPLNGTAKPFGALIMGADLVAVDATCCRLMCLDPERIAYLGLGYQKRLGLLREAEIPQLGETIYSLAQPFDTVPHLNPLRTRRPA